MRNIFIKLSLVLFCVMLTVNSFGFNHPGGMHTTADLDFVISKLDANEEPWSTAWTNFKVVDADNYQGIDPLPFSSINYVQHTYDCVECGSYNNPNVGCNDIVYDGKAAYSLALRFYLTGDDRYASKAINIIRDWSAEFDNITDSNARLVISWAAPWYANAGELLRHTANSGWSSNNTTQLNTLLNKFKNYYIWSGRPHNNWVMASIEAQMAVAIFQDDQSAYDDAIQMWKDRIITYIFQSSDGSQPIPPSGESQSWTNLQWHDGTNRTGTSYVDGLCMETCRDLNHSKLGFVSIVNVAEMAWNQGDDLFSLEKDRLIDFLELHTDWMNGGSVSSYICDGYLDLVENSKTAFELAYNHLHDRLGESLPNTLTMINSERPQSITTWVGKWETLAYAGRTFDMEGTYKFKNKATGNYLDSDGAIVMGKSYTGNDDQLWNLVLVSNDEYNIDSYYSGRGCLDSDGSGGVAGTSVEPVASGSDKKWTIESLGDDTYRFKNATSGRDYLAENRTTHVVGYTSWDGKRAQWVLEYAATNRSGTITSTLSTTNSLRVDIYPNPATENVTIHLSGINSAVVSIINANGKIVFKGKMSEKLTIPIQGTFTSGLYLIRVNSDEKQFIKKLVIK